MSFEMIAEEPVGQLLAFDFAERIRPVANIRVVGVGGAGGNAINRMIAEQVRGVDFIALNTDCQALDMSQAAYRIDLGKKLTSGRGVGGNPEKGRKAIEESKQSVIDALADSDMVFITAGMGGGTGTGAAPTVAQIAKDLGALTVAIVTKPFQFEGNVRMERAEAGIRELKDNVDTLIVVPNEKLISLVPVGTSLVEAFKIADSILLQATKGVSDIINVPRLINRDFEDVKTVMSQMGDAMMGIGEASGENRGAEAAKRAIHNPLIEDISIMGALGVLVNFEGGEQFGLHDTHEAMQIIQDAVGPQANIYWGAGIEPNMGDKIRVTVIATGFHRDGARSIYFRGKDERPVSKTATIHGTVTERIRSNPLEAILGSVAAGEGMFSFSPKDDLNIPAYIRKADGILFEGA